MIPVSEPGQGKEQLAALADYAVSGWRGIGSAKQSQGKLSSITGIPPAAVDEDVKDEQD